MQLASHLGLPLQYVKATTTVSEFFEWRSFLRTQHLRQDYYLAQIALEVCRGRVKDPSKVRLEDFLLRHATTLEEVDKVDTSKMTEEEKKAYRKKISAESSALWKACTVIPKGSKRKPNKKEPKQ